MQKWGKEVIKYSVCALLTGYLPVFPLKSEVATHFQVMP